MINKQEKTWWTITKMIIGLPGGLLSLSLAFLFIQLMFIEEFYWEFLAFGIGLAALGGFLITTFILGIIKLVKNG